MIRKRLPEFDGISASPNGGTIRNVAIVGVFDGTMRNAGPSFGKPPHELSGRAQKY